MWDAGLLPGAVFIPSEADVGSAKQETEHPPGFTGLNFALHGHAGSKNEQMRLHLLIFLFITKY